MGSQTCTRPSILGSISTPWTQTRKPANNATHALKNCNPSPGLPHLGHKTLDPGPTASHRQEVAVGQGPHPQTHGYLARCQPSSRVIFLRKPRSRHRGHIPACALIPKTLANAGPASAHNQGYILERDSPGGEGADLQVRSRLAPTLHEPRAEANRARFD